MAHPVVLLQIQVSCARNEMDRVALSCSPCLSALLVSSLLTKSSLWFIAVPVNNPSSLLCKKRKRKKMELSVFRFLFLTGKTLNSIYIRTSSKEYRWSIKHCVHLLCICVHTFHRQVHRYQAVLLPHWHPLFIPLCHHVHNHPACAWHAYELCSKGKQRGDRVQS